MTETLPQLSRRLSACRLCIEAGHAVAPGPIFNHVEGAEVMLIGQAPGVTEVEAQRPFNAGSGRRLFQWLGDAGWDEDTFRRECTMTAVTKCYPGKATTGKGDRVPSKAEQLLCRPYLEQELEIVDPRLVIPVGGLAIKLFFPNRLRLDQVIGTAAYFPPDVRQKGVRFSLKGARRLDHFDPALPGAGRWMVPLPHPSGASLWPNRPENQALIARAIALLKDIREAWHL